MVPGVVSGVIASVVVHVAVVGVDTGVGVGKSVRLSVREDLVLIGVAPKITFASIVTVYAAVAMCRGAVV